MSHCLILLLLTLLPVFPHPIILCSVFYLPINRNSSCYLEPVALWFILSFWSLKPLSCLPTQTLTILQDLFEFHSLNKTFSNSLGFHWFLLSNLARESHSTELKYILLWIIPYSLYVLVLCLQLHFKFPEGGNSVLPFFWPPFSK